MPERVGRVSVKRTVRTDARREHVVLGRMLKELREAKGLTQRDVALKLGRGHSYLWKIETGFQHVEIATLIDLANILGTDAAQLIGAVIQECNDGPDAPVES